jgi:hypothetical protein
MQEAQKKNSRPEAAERICKLLEELIGKANEMIQYTRDEKRFESTERNRGENER